MSLAKEATIFVGVQFKYMLIGIGLLSLGISLVSFSWTHVPVYAMCWLAGGVVCRLSDMFTGK